MSLLMEALKRAEREKHKIAPDESAQEESSASLALEPDWPSTPEPLQDKSPFPSLKLMESTPCDTTPEALLAGEGAMAKDAGFDLLPPEPDPATTTALPPVAATAPAFSPSAGTVQPRNAIPPLQPPAPQEGPAPLEPLPLRTEPPLRNGAPSAGKPPLAQEATAAQRQQHAANVLAATQKTPARNRLLPAAFSAAAILLLAGGIYLYWQYPQLLSTLEQGVLHPAPIAPLPAPATAAAVAPSPPPAPLPSTPPMLTAAETPPSDTSPADRRQTPPPPAASPPAAPLAEQAPAKQTPKDSAITIRRGTHNDQVAPALTQGYSAFMAGNDRLAQQEYASILRKDGNNRDALLGMAAIAAKHGRGDEAIRIYQRLQELDPRDAVAQAGMLAQTAGQADPVQSESRIKTLLAQQPDAHFLYFALGNLYSGQSRWSEAQQAFFRAYQKAPNNPDYLYNLAVSLDHLNQGKLALEYYQRALAQSQSGPANFDIAAAQSRAKELMQPAGK